MSTSVLSFRNQVVEKAPYTAALIQALDGIGEHLTAWEQEYVVSVTERFFTHGIALSTKQLLRLEKLYRLYF